MLLTVYLLNESHEGFNVGHQRARAQDSPQCVEECAKPSTKVVLPSYRL